VDLSSLDQMLEWIRREQILIKESILQAEKLSKQTDLQALLSRQAAFDEKRQIILRYHRLHQEGDDDDFLLPRARGR